MAYDAVLRTPYHCGRADASTSRCLCMGVRFIEIRARQHRIKAREPATRGFGSEAAAYVESSSVRTGSQESRRSCCLLRD